MKAIRSQNGFTLTEIAIVMLILGLVIAAGITPLTRLIQSSQIASNQERLEAAREALLAFAAVNGRLPCPDRTGDGIEDQRTLADPVGFGCAGNLYEGFLPWATLGVQQTDYWGTRLRYRVSVQFTRAGADPAWTCGTVNGQSLAGTTLAGCTA
ncbi:MAG: type II secretion system protein, partial [Burkholderiales bacterium]|nr:type II secretion system protein [Burkholderiales bacterium]